MVDVLPQRVHGGSMRYVIAHKGARQASERVTEQRSKEDALGLNCLETFMRFRQNVERSRDELMQLLWELKAARAPRGRICCHF